jgi:thiol-disulfide isomerase/thioredoxin
MATKWFNRSNVLNAAFFAIALALVFNPSAKALVIEGMMKVGLFQPKLSHEVIMDHAAVTLPDVVFQSPNGKTIRLSEQKGKVVFINFWATWCPPCIAEMPSISGLYEKLKSNRNVAFIMVDADHNFQKSVPFMTKHRFAMPLYQLAGNVPESLASNNIPTTTIIDKSGKIVFHQEGSADYSNPKILAYLNEISK